MKASILNESVGLCCPLLVVRGEASGSTFFTFQGVYSDTSAALTPGFININSFILTTILRSVCPTASFSRGSE